MRACRLQHALDTCASQWPRVRAPPNRCAEVVPPRGGAVLGQS